MNIIWKGSIDKISNISNKELPNEAKQFKEPNNPIFITIGTVIIGILLLNINSILNTYRLKLNIENIVFIVIIGILAMVIPSIIRILLEGKNITYEAYFEKSTTAVYLLHTEPIKKKNYIVSNLCSNLILGLIMLIIYFYIPGNYEAIRLYLSIFIIIELSCGIGNYINLYNAIKLPKGAVIITPTMHSYWYIPEDKNGDYKDKKNI